MVDVYVAAAFSKDDKGGNKAGVVLGRVELTSVQKVAIAKEMGYSETAFVLGSDKADFMIANMSKEKEVVGVHAFTMMKESDVTAICRNFAPLYGIDEESATGTESCALACYLFKYYKHQSQYIFEQGHHMGEISCIIVNLSYHGDVIDSVFVGGYGHLLGKKSLPV